MIRTEKEYKIIAERIEELLENADIIENANAKGYIELNILYDLVADYEETNYPIALPNLIDVIKLRMYEQSLTQKNYLKF